MPREYVARCALLHTSDLQAIEATHRKSPRSLSEWERLLRNPHRHAYAVMRDGHLLGYVIFEEFVDCLFVREFIVHSKHRRQGLGRRLVRFLIEYANGHGPDRTRFSSIDLFVHERSWQSQVFLRECGLKCTGTKQGRDGEDVYLFQWWQFAELTGATR